MDRWVGLTLTIILRWGESYPEQFRIQTSSDGLHPQSWKDVTGDIAGAKEVQSIPLSRVNARHVRLLIPTAANAGDRGYILYSFEVYGNNELPENTKAPPFIFADGALLLAGGNWKLQNASFVQATPAAISQDGFTTGTGCRRPFQGPYWAVIWPRARSPDPWYGDQNSQISEEFFTRNDFWYRTSFDLPRSFTGKRVWLNFDGINWKADVYLNGGAAGRIDGVFVRSRFDVTSLVRTGGNRLAVLIHKVPHSAPSPGKVLHKTLGAPTKNGDLLGYDSPTFLASAGWNWLPIVRGRNVGIWNDVHLESSGAVTIIDPWVVTDELTADHTRADLSIKVELRNHLSTRQSGKIIGSIGKLTFERAVDLGPGETRALSFDKVRVPALSLTNPRLWWPNGYGGQPLYKLELRFEQRGKVSDKRTVAFGVRKLEHKVVDNVLTFYVNDARILIRGGNWGMAEGMLRCDAAGYDLRVRLHRDANFNMIRNWVGMEGREAFYDACDRHGVLIWDDFWLANPVDGPNPTDFDLFMANAREKIRRVRKHPSLALYCGRNEGNPPAELDAAIRRALGELDTSRLYIPHSAAGAVTGGGPYDVRDVAWYFANRGKTLHSELGIVAVPPVESMREMMPPENLWPINDMWAVHNYQTPRSDLYTQRLRDRYGEPSGIEDYCRKAQMINIESAKAMYECLQARQGSGILLWMTQAAWPSLICQLYDYYFEMTGAYFGAKRGCEPVHIMWDSHADVIKVANNTASGTGRLTARMRVYSMDGTQLDARSAIVDLAPASVADVFPIQRPTTESGVFFVKLTLERADKTISENFYWSSVDGGSCKALNSLPNVTLAARARRSQARGALRFTVSLSNATQVVAPAVRLKVQRSGLRPKGIAGLLQRQLFWALAGRNQDCDAGTCRGKSCRRGAGNHRRGLEHPAPANSRPLTKGPLNQRFGWVNSPAGSQDMWRDWGRSRATTTGRLGKSRGGCHPRQNRQRRWDVPHSLHFQLLQPRSRSRARGRFHNLGTCHEISRGRPAAGQLHPRAQLHTDIPSRLRTFAESVVRLRRSISAAAFLLPPVLRRACSRMPRSIPAMVCS